MKSEAVVEGTAVGRTEAGGNVGTQSVGKSVACSDREDRVTGAALYLDDLRVEGLWQGATLRSPHALARIRSIDTSALSELPEVAVVTAADLPGPNVIRLIEDDWPALADSEVRHVGEAVALVAAPTLARAKQAAAAIRVDYEVLEGPTTLDQALAAETHGAARVLSRCAIDHGDVDAAFASAEHIVQGEYETGYQEHIYLETQGAIASVAEDGAVDVVGSLQCPFFVHKALVHLLGEQPDRVRVRQSVTGGGFGGKEDYPSMIAGHAALLARACGHPVKIVYDRHEDIIATTKRHPARICHRTGVRGDGTLVAMDIEVLLDGGAYATLSPVVLSRAVIHAAGPYRCDNVRVRGRVLATHTATNGAFRGFGAPQVMFAVERQMDRIARELGFDPFQVRYRNAYREGDVTPTGQVLKESVSAAMCLETAVARTDFVAKWRRHEASRQSAPDDGQPRRGIGLSLFWHGAGFTGEGERRMMAKAAVRLGRGGRVEILAGATDIGQGTQAVLRQVVAETLGFPLGHVAVHQPDTAVVPDSGPTVASRTVMVVGEILSRAAAELRAVLVAHAAQRVGVVLPADFEGVRFVDGRLVGPDGGDLGALEEVADDYLDVHHALLVERQFEPATAGVFDEQTYRGDAYACYGWGCDVVEVDWDPDTFEVHPRRVTAVADVGKAIHPVFCAGQVEGGTLQALAWGYLEELKVDRGRYLNDRMQTYMIPTLADAPDCDTVLLENPSSAGPFGAKGVGELPMDGGAPALVQAIENASGIQPSAIPATPERLLSCLRAGRVLGDPVGGLDE